MFCHFGVGPVGDKRQVQKKITTHSITSPLQNTPRISFFMGYRGPFSRVSRVRDDLMMGEHKAIICLKLPLVDSSGEREYACHRVLLYPAAEPVNTSWPLFSPRAHQEKRSDRNNTQFSIMGIPTAFLTPHHHVMRVRLPPLLVHSISVFKEESPQQDQK